MSSSKKKKTGGSNKGSSTPSSESKAKGSVILTPSTPSLSSSQHQEQEQGQEVYSTPVTSTSRTKATPKSHSGAGPGGAGSPLVTVTGSSLSQVKLLFQKYTSSEVDIGYVGVNNKDMKYLNIRGGGYLEIEGPQGNAIICRVKFLSTVPQGNILLHRFWLPNFEAKDKVSISQPLQCLLTQSVARASFKLLQGEISENHLPIFLEYLKNQCVGHLLFAPNCKVMVLWKAKQLVLQLESCSPPLVQSNELNHNHKRYYTFVQSSSVNVELSSASELVHPSNSLENVHENIGGYKHIIDEVYTYLRDSLLEWDKVYKAGFNGNVELTRGLLKRPKGLLLYGPHGTGKSELIRAIANVFRCEHNIASYVISSDILLYRMQGEAEAHVAKTFHNAKENGPSLIIVDDIDVLCQNRATSDSDLQKRIISTFLTLLDGGVHEEKPVFLLCASSKPNNLDPAMRRPGRIDKEVEMTIPTAIERSDIFKTILERLLGSVYANQNATKFTTTICPPDYQVFGQKSHGMVGSDILLVCKESFVKAVNRAFNVKEGDLSSLRLDEKPTVLMTKSDVCLTADDVLHAISKGIPSAIREIAVEVPETHWSDIGGMEMVKQSLKEVVEWPLVYPELFEAAGLDPPRGVLLYGPPGCSKTLMAKALATESGLNFLAVRGPELLSKWLGESEKAVQTLFKRARSVAPSLIFFDEIDAFACKRGESSSGVNDRVLSQLLTEIDGVHGGKQVIVIAATNRPDLLDNALLRPGRIDRKIYVPPPDFESRKQIISKQLSKMPHCCSEDDINEFVASTDGYSGAEVVSCCSDAAMLAIEENADEVQPIHLRKAIQECKPQITAEMLAYFEGIKSSFFV